MNLRDYNNFRNDLQYLIIDLENYNKIVLISHGLMGSCMWDSIKNRQLFKNNYITTLFSCYSDFCKDNNLSNSYAYSKPNMGFVENIIKQIKKQYNDALDRKIS